MPVLDVFSILAALNRHRLIILAGTVLGTLVAIFLGVFYALGWMSF